MMGVVVMMSLSGLHFCMCKVRCGMLRIGWTHLLSWFVGLVGCP